MKERLDGVQLGLAQVRADLEPAERREAERKVLQRFADLLLVDFQNALEDRVSDLVRELSDGHAERPEAAGQQELAL